MSVDFGEAADAEIESSEDLQSQASDFFAMAFDEVLHIFSQITGEKATLTVLEDVGSQDYENGLTTDAIGSCMDGFDGKQQLQGGKCPSDRLQGKETRTDTDEVLVVRSLVLPEVRAALNIIVTALHPV